MLKLTRLFSAAAAVVAIAGFGVSGAAAQVATADAQPFIGAWDLTVQADGPITLGLDIRDEGGQVAASVTAQGSATNVTTITKSDDNLLLRYMADLGGQQAPIAIRLTPNGEELAASLDVADGMFTTSGTARKR